MGNIPSYFSYGKEGGDGNNKNGEHHLIATAAEQTQMKRPTPKNCLPLLGDGEFDVGCADLMVSGSNEDENRKEECGVFARIFYPIRKNGPENSSISDQFLSWKPEEEYVNGLADYREMSPRKMNFFLDWVLGDKRIPVEWQVDIEEDRRKFPIAIFSHGISGNRFFYTTFCASLASHGFVVAAIEHRDGSCCYTFEMENDGAERIPIKMKKLPHGEEEYEHRITQVKKRVDETIKMLRIFEKINKGFEKEEVDQILIGKKFKWGQFKDRLDFGQVVSIGHSFGGASALTACALEKKFTSCILLDGWLYPFERRHYGEVIQPILMLNASKWQWPINVKRLLHLQNQGEGIGKLMFTFSDIVHQTFSDFGLLCPGFIGHYFGLQGDLNPEYTGNAIVELCIKFLQNPMECSAQLRSLVIQKYNKFIAEGTDIAKEELEKIDAKLSMTHSVEIGEDEEKRLTEGNTDTRDDLINGSPT